MRIFLLAAIGLISCSVAPEQPPVMKADEPFAAAGSIEMHLEGGGYTIRASADEHVRVSFAGNYEGAAAELKTNGSHADLAIRNTPRNNFRATVEVPATADLTIRLTGGNLEVGAIKGSKDIESTAGNVEISTPDSGEYGSVVASVKAGDLNGGPFGGSGAGLSPSLKWTGPGKYTLHASLGAGNLELKR